MSGSGFDGAARAALRAVVRDESRRPAQPEVLALVATLHARFGSEFAGALYYGSCRRQDRPEGLVDLHVLVRDPVRALGPLSGRLCRLLPPNVYYLEVDHGGERVRCKYAVLGLHDFRGACTRRAFHSYFWARYAQPLSVLGVAPGQRRAIEESLVDALVTLFSRSLPRLPPVEAQAEVRARADAGAHPEARPEAHAEAHAEPAASALPATSEDAALALWGRMLALCYRCELRPEGAGRAAALVDGQRPYFARTGAVALAAREQLRGHGTPELARVAWGLRIGWGKVVSLLRLLKALQTFDGGLDYAAWKLERHTGRHIDIPDRVRRRPWLHIWPHLLRLWREGAFR